VILSRGAKHVQKLEISICRLYETKTLMFSVISGRMFRRLPRAEPLRGRPVFPSMIVD
jgi:hypothetical protein